MAKSPKQKEIIQTAVLGGSAAGGMFLGKASNSYYPEEKKKSAGLKVITGLAVFGLTALASANMADGLANKAVVGLGAGLGGEKLVSAASDYISTTDLLDAEIVDGKEVKDSVKDFISAGLKGADSTCGCTTALPQRTVYPTLNFPIIPMVEVTPNKYTAESFA